MNRERLIESSHRNEDEKEPCYYHGTTKPDIDEFEPRKRLVPGGVNHKEQPAAVYAGDNPAFAAGHSIPWSSEEGFELGFENDQVVLRVPKEHEYRLDRKVYIYQLPREGFSLTQGEGTGHSFQTEQKVRPIAVQEFGSVTEAIEHFGGVVVIEDKDSQGH